MLNIYQVRGFVLANTFFVKSDRVWSIIDPLTTKETTGAALKLVNRHMGKFPVKAMVCDHLRSACDGIEANDRACKVEIIAPRICPRDRKSVLHADCQTVSRCITRVMDEAQGWVC